MRTERGQGTRTFWAAGRASDFALREMGGYQPRRAESSHYLWSPPCLVCPSHTPCFWTRLDAAQGYQGPGLSLPGSNPSPSTDRLEPFNFSVPQSPPQKNGADKNLSFRSDAGQGKFPRVGRDQAQH